MKREKVTAAIGENPGPWDVVIIGGGATGVGCAVDAATRGLSVLLLEQHDFGKGTSSRSTKLVHGGVRYLRQGDISLVREALRERGTLLKNAPDLVSEQQFLIPCYSVLDKLFYGVGMKLYDMLSGRYAVTRSRVVSRAEAIELAPTAVTKGLSGGVVYYDGRFDDTRLLIGLVQTAATHGAVLLNYAKVSGITRDSSGRVNGVTFIDVETETEVSVSARTVINATGVFTDPVRKMTDASAKPLLKFAQGIHIVVDGRFLGSQTSIMIPKTNDGRVLFCIPWYGQTLIGTTDTLVDKAELEPRALASEIEFLIENASKYLSGKPTVDDVLSVFAGIRPLIANAGKEKTSSISRSHDIFVDAAGLITVTGGKWTTYRRMAEDAIHKAIKVGGLAERECVTETIAIHYDAGSLGGRRLHQKLDHTENDVIRAVRTEMARSVEDVLARRTRALFLDARAAIEMAPRVAAIMASELDFDDDWIRRQIDEFSTLAREYLIRSDDVPRSDAD